MRASRQEATGAAGQSAVTQAFQRLRWGVSPNPEHDLGTDLWLMARDERGFDLGAMVGAQVKSGPSFFERSLVDAEGCIVGWWFYEKNHEHFDYWIAHGVPHVVVLHDPAQDVSYWVEITRDAVKWFKKGAKILVPRAQTVQDTDRSSLNAVAFRHRALPAWEGSIWRGATDIAAADRMRYGLVAPRLVAPHPNTSGADLDPVAAVASLVLLRFQELDRFGAPDSRSAAIDGIWEWDLYFGLRGYLTEGDLGVIRAALDGAELPHQAAAACALLAALLLERGNAEEALEYIENELALDRASPVDHAWISTQKSRALMELGRFDEAREVVLGIQSLQKISPADPTAMALVSAATKQIFAATRVTEGDLEGVLTASDTTVGWWRSQVTASGLDSNFDSSFKAFAGDTAIVFRSGDPAWQRIRSVTLMSGIAGDHGDWRHSMSQLARMQLQDDGLATSETVVDSLQDLRWAGDKSSVGLIVRCAVDWGPADAVRDVAGSIDLSKSTRTSASSDLELVRRAADVLAEADADRHARWAMQVIAAPGDYQSRVRPQFMLSTALVSMLAALMPATSVGVRKEILDHVLGLPVITDQSVAHDYGRLVGSIPEGEWDDEAVIRASERQGDQWELANAFAAATTRHDPEVRAGLVDRVESGDIEALALLNNVEGLSIEAVRTLLVALKARVDSTIRKARGGIQDVGTQVNEARAVAILCMEYPGAADWQPILNLLAEPAVPAREVRPALQVISARPELVPPSIADEIAPLLESTMKRSSSSSFDFLREGSLQGDAAAALAALRPDLISDIHLYEQSVGSAEQRRALARIFGHREQPAEFAALVMLAGDSDPEVRSAASFYIARWAARGVAREMSTQVLLRLLDDPGTRVLRAISSALVGENSSGTLEEAVLKLRSCRSARARETASAV